jgi:hypothetical protein
MDSPKYIGIVKDQHLGVELAASGDDINEVDRLTMTAWRTASDGSVSSSEPPLWDSYVRLRQVVKVLGQEAYIKLVTHGVDQ